MGVASAIAVEDGAPSCMLLWGTGLESASPPALRTTEKSATHCPELTELT